MNKLVVLVPQIQDRIFEILKIIPQDRVQQRTEVQTIDIPVPHTGSMLPTTLWGKSPCEVAASVIRRLQNSSSWTDSEAECRFSVFLACSQRRCGESPHVKLRQFHQKTTEHQFVDRQCSRVLRSSLRWSSSQLHSHAVSAHLRASTEQKSRRFRIFRISWIFGFFQLGKVQNFPASRSSSELGAHQMAPSGVIAH